MTDTTYKRYPEISNTLKDKFPVVHKKPLMIKDRSSGEYRQIGELSYITSRQVMERLDDAFGPFNWTTAFQVIETSQEGQSVYCTLTVTMPDGTTVSRADFGYGENKSGADNGLKAAASDALKRAAVQFGIGRYLYEEDRDIERANAQHAEQRRRRNTDNTSSSNTEEYSRATFIYNKLKKKFAEIGITGEDFETVFDTEFSEQGIANLINEGYSLEKIIEEIVSS